jgi:predicted homoserine dehydrogenase-like protein
LICSSAMFFWLVAEVGQKQWKDMAMSSEKIRVGIIGAGGGAKCRPIPVLQSMGDFEIVAISSRKLETVQEAGRPVSHSTCFLTTFASYDSIEPLTGGARL